MEALTYQLCQFRFTLFPQMHLSVEQGSLLTVERVGDDSLCCSKLGMLLLAASRLINLS